MTKSLYVHRTHRSERAIQAQRHTHFTHASTIRHGKIQRIRYYAEENPRVLFGGWSALALHGLEFWVDAAPLTIATPYAGNRGRPETMSIVREELHDPPLEEWTVRGVGISAVPWEYALVSALKDVFRRRCEWFVVDIPGMNAADIRAIQVVDAVRSLQLVRWDEERVRAAAVGKIDGRRLRRILNQSDAGSDSPPETLLRLLLIASDVLPVGTWESQVPILRDGSFGQAGQYHPNAFTRPDLMCRELKIAVYYDGSVHRSQKTFDKDQKIQANLSYLGWRYLRVTWGMLCNPKALITAVRAMVEQAGHQL